MYNDLKTALLAMTSIRFAEFAWRNAPATGSYGVFAPEYGSDSVRADNITTEQSITGSVDVFVRSGDGRAEARAVQSVLNQTGVAWRLNSITFEDDRNVIHWEWVFSCESGLI